jgi:predicted exporter
MQRQQQQQGDVAAELQYVTECNVPIQVCCGWCTFLCIRVALLLYRRWRCLALNVVPLLAGALGGRHPVNSTLLLCEALFGCTSTH